MKHFKEYLIESKKTYSFKIKIAGDLKEGFNEKLKMAMEKFELVSLSSGKRTPIQETPLDFPNSKFTHVNVFDVEVSYPTTPSVLENYLGHMCEVSMGDIRVRASNEPSEYYQELMNVPPSDKDEVLLKTDYSAEDNQSLVGEKSKLSLIKELDKIKHQGEQYKGVNDKLLADKIPTEKSQTSETTGNIKSPIGSKGK
jgi:hypothetical protein